MILAKKYFSQFATIAIFFFTIKDEKFRYYHQKCCKKVYFRYIRRRYPRDHKMLENVIKTLKTAASYKPWSYNTKQENNS